MIILKENILDFETDMHFLFPNEGIKDSDKYQKYAIISEKTKQDGYYFRYNEEDYSSFGDTYYK